MLEENLQKDRDISEIQRENFKKALKAGVKMIFSTDAGVYPHGANARQFAVMVRYGATPLQAIQTATTLGSPMRAPRCFASVAMVVYSQVGGGDGYSN